MASNVPLSHPREGEEVVFMREWSAGVETDGLRCRFPSFLKACIWSNKALASPNARAGPRYESVWLSSLFTLLSI